MLQDVVIEEYTSFPGVRWRLKDPTTRLVLKITGQPNARTFQRYRTWFEQRDARCFRLFEGEFPGDWLVNPEADPLAVHLAAGITALQRLGMQPVRRAQVLEAAGDQIVLALPSFHGAVLNTAIRLAIQLLLELDALGEGADALPPRLEQDLDGFVTHAPEVSRCGEETLRFALAADRLGIPLVCAMTGYLEIGHGAARRILSNSLLATASPPATLASDKLASYLVLQRAGLPVPATKIVNIESELEAAAAELGWPLVVKPLDQSLQQGVTTDVDDLISLQAAFLVARNVSRNSVLLQQQVRGVEFRLTAIGPHHASARQINPAMVVGDGRSSVAQLVAATNADPLRGLHPAAICPPIALDDEAHQQLRLQGLSLEAVPPAGREVRLSRAAGRRFGGRTTEPSELHPSYLELLQRVRRVMQLDVLGLDLITPDPSRPWWEVGARILEGNSRPGLIQHEQANPSLRIYHQALTHAFSGIAMPLVVAVAVSETFQSCLPVLEAALLETLPAGQRLGGLNGTSCRLGGDPLPLDPKITDQVGQALLADPLCGAALLAWRAEELARYGRPCETLDLAVLSAGAEPLVLQECLDADPGAVIWLGPESEPDKETLAAWQRRFPERPLQRLAGPEQLAGALRSLLRAIASEAAAL